jgi:DNA-binding transcriptional ArsR family regulator
MDGDPDIAAVGALLAEPARARMLLALDQRALPASVLALEAGIAPSTASGHLARLVDGGFLRVERHGRHRYYRLAEPQIGELLESLAQFAPKSAVRSLREGTRANALRTARSCYDHLAGKLGTSLMQALLANGWLDGGDGSFVPGGADRLAGPGYDVEYRLTATGRRRLETFGIVPGELPGRRQLIRYCVDWSEQRHHLGGKLGAALLDRMLELEWLTRARGHRALQITDDGRTGLERVFRCAAP